MLTTPPPLRKRGVRGGEWQRWSAGELGLRGGMQVMQQNVLPLWRLLVAAMLAPQEFFHSMGLVAVRLSGSGQFMQT